MRAVAQITITNICDVVTSDTPPENPYYGQLWVNTATAPPETMVWDGQGWAVQNNLEDLRETVSTNTTRFGEFQSSVDGLNSYVSTMTETVERLEGSVSGEQEKVLEMQAQISEFEHTVDGLSVSVQEQFAGSINYIKNSAGLNGITNDWITTGTVSTDSTTNVQNNTTSDSCFVLGETSTLKQVVTGAVTGTSYAISLRAKKTGASYSSYFYVQYNGNKMAYLFNTTGTFDWTEFSAVIPDVQDSTITIYAYNSSAGLYISDIMLVEGGTIHKWTPAPNGTTASNTTGAQINLSTVDKSGAMDVVVTATDSRGYTVSNTQKITVIPYARPKISSVSLRRTNDIEAEMQLTFNGSISPITISGTQKNSLKYVQYRYKLTSAASYGAYTSILADVTQNGTSFSFSNLELCSLDANSSYDFHLYIRDQLNTLSAVSLYFTVPQGTPLVALRKKKVGINTPNPTAALHVVGDARIEGTLTPTNINFPFDKPYFGTCSTAEATQAKVVACSGFKLKTGARIAVQFTYSNTASQPTLNVNGTGAKYICCIDGTSVVSGIWRAKETVDFVYDGSWWIAIGCLYATTSSYGIAKLSSSISSTSTSLAATPSAVKKAYDRNSWTSISLTNALAVGYGGTGAKNAASARTNLGISATSLYNGTLTSGSITFNYGSYNFYSVLREKFIEAYNEFVTQRPQGDNIAALQSVVSGLKKE